MTAEEAVDALLAHDACAEDGRPWAEIIRAELKRLRAELAAMESEHPCCSGAELVERDARDAALDAAS